MEVTPKERLSSFNLKQLDASPERLLPVKDIASVSAKPGDSWYGEYGWHWRLTSVLVR